MNNSMQNTLRYHKAFKEVYLLINDLSSDLYVKIPKSFIKTIIVFSSYFIVQARKFHNSLDK